MKRVGLLFSLLGVVSCASLAHKGSVGASKNGASDKLYVVQRERESLAVVQNETLVKTIPELGNLNHATIKYKGNVAFVLSRDGVLSKVDTEKDLLLKKIKIAKSGIGITFAKDYVVVVNYDPQSVVILDQDLNTLQTVATQSRNVGVKFWDHYIVFSLMDKNEIWVLDINKNFEVAKKIENIGALPFDALIKDNLYIVGFFNEGAVGILDLKDFSYHKITVKDPQDKVVFKVPHFGFWGILGDLAVVPLTGAKSLLVIDLNKMVGIKEIPLEGNPVFASVSPDKKHLAINYSGDQEDLVSLIRTSDWTKESDLKAGHRVMHLRYSYTSDRFYVTSYFENMLHVYSTQTWKKLYSVPVSTPSGIFIEDEKGLNDAK